MQSNRRRARGRDGGWPARLSGRTVLRLGDRRHAATRRSPPTGSRRRGTRTAGLYATAPAAAVAEEVAGAWILELLDLPRDASFAFVTGCQMAHFTALAAARACACCAAAGWNVERTGCSARRRSASSRTRRATARSTVRCAISASASAQCARCPTTTTGRVTPEALTKALATRTRADDRRARRGRSQHGRLRLVRGR